MPPEPKPCILATRPTRRLKLSLTLDGAADHLSRTPTESAALLTTTSSRMPDSAKPVVAIVDPISTGASLAKFLADLGYPLVRVFSDTLPDEVRRSWKTSWPRLRSVSPEASLSTRSCPGLARAPAASAALACHIGLVLDTR